MQLWTAEKTVSKNGFINYKRVFYFSIDKMCSKDSYLLCFGQCDGFVVSGSELNMLAESTIHQWAHSAKDPDVTLWETGEEQISFDSQREELIWVFSCSNTRIRLLRTREMR